MEGNVRSSLIADLQIQQVVRLVPEIDAPITWQSFNLAMVIVHKYVLCT